MSVHKTILIILYATGFLFALMVAAKGLGYYVLPIGQRPFSGLHRTLKPGGLWGHGLGILGSSMLLLLFLYSARKRNVLGLRFGKMSYWLNIHIFLGIMGPVFVTLHTAFKFGGIVSVSYFSMIAVMLSGFIGRYLYVQIPRTLSGDKLTIREIDEKDKLMTRVLVEEHGVNPKLLARIQTIAGLGSKDAKGFALLWLLAKNDLTRRSKLRALRKQLLKKNRNLPAQKIDRLLALMNEKVLLTRKKALLSSIQPLFHYWHVAHKPFAYVMLIIMFLHVALTITFGYRWIF